LSSVLKTAYYKRLIMVLSFRYVTSFDEESFTFFEEFIKDIKKNNIFILRETGNTMLR
jgi:hypothetical protein